ncbi:MAG: PilZ domain-containing protein [bacterium]|nr:PilZ domain-containing protein [bacterium]
MSTEEELANERRNQKRVNSTLAVIYQRISAREIEADPYDTRFELPQHFTLNEELTQIDNVQRSQVEALMRENPRVGGLIQALNLKLDIIAQAIEDSLGRMLSPVPQRVNLSQGGLSFHAAEPITPGNYLHIAISNQARNYHVAAIGRVVFCEDEDLEGYRTGVAFVNIRHHDRQTLARDISRKVQEDKPLEGFENPENG